MIEPARFDWRDGQPYAPDFQDIYHSADGSGEVQRVFLQPADFDTLLQQQRPLLVGELGFGTGLNFAVIAEQCRTAGVPLHFVSVEAAPIAPQIFAGIGQQRQGSQPIYRPLADVYPPLVGGWHRRRFHHGLITLSVYWGDVSSGLSQLVAQQQRPFDLWLLDGFAPDRNPSMWTAELFENLASLSTQGTAVTTFTAAGRVRRALEAQGFNMRRVDQRPHKRESLAGFFQATGRKRPAPVREVQIIGAGIAGASTARELAESGISVTVFEASGQVAAGASGIPITLMHPRLLADDSASACLRASAYAHALAACRSYLSDPAAESHGSIVKSGALQLASANYSIDRLAAVEQCYGASGLAVELLSAADASDLSGLTIEDPALWFADACTVSTPAFCQALLDHPNIDVRTGHSLPDWPSLPTVLACGFGVRAFPGADYLEVAEVSGQLDLIRATDKTLQSLKLPVIGSGYLAADPAADNRFGVGATYEYSRWPATKATEKNLQLVDRLAPGAYQPLSTHKGTRSVSSDRHPIIGNLYDLNQRELVGKFVTSGHGSMGTVTSHLAAAILGARLIGDFTPLAPAQEALVSPLRFRVRQARRGYRFGASN